MYETIAVLAAILLGYCVFAGRIERSTLSGPILFTAVGYFLGLRLTDVLHVDVTSTALRSLAEMTLAMVLFSDAASADFSIIRRHVGVPVRLLLIGLPLTILLGLLIAWPLFPSLGVLELGLLATILAPTDAALGAPVVANKAVPAVVRESLNLESGLNDGICVPIVVILLGYAVGVRIEHGTLTHATLVVAEEFGIGLLVGLGLTVCAGWVFGFAKRAEWLSEDWWEVPALALAACCFATAQALGGSGFIACFASGLLVSPLTWPRKHDWLRGSETVGRILAALTWILFGAAVVTRLPTWTHIPSLIYAVLSLTVIRMVPVFLCLRGSEISTQGKLFMGWFGPRGLASIVFAIIAFDARLPGNQVLMGTIAWTILLSVVLHGVTANPWIQRFAAATGRP
ncbi:MAG: cation:proton antiporter [Acetobacteraceae bacterium]